MLNQTHNFILDFLDPDPAQSPDVVERLQPEVDVAHVVLLDVAALVQLHPEVVDQAGVHSADLNNAQRTSQ